MNFGRLPLIGSKTHPRPPHLPSVSQEQLEALDAVENTARKVQLEISTEPGDVHFINNLFIFHRREGFINDERSAERRHLVRMRLRDDDFRFDLPRCLETEWSYAFSAASPQIWHIEPMPDGFFPLRSQPN